MIRSIYTHNRHSIRNWKKRVKKRSESESVKEEKDLQKQNLKRNIKRILEKDSGKISNDIQEILEEDENIEFSQRENCEEDSRSKKEIQIEIQWKP